MPRSRTITSAMTRLEWPEATQGPTFAFDGPRDAVRVTVPPTSRWSMPYHWHLQASSEALHLLPGGDAEFFRSLGPYRNSSESGSSGMVWKLRRRERSYWRINTHRPQNSNSPALEGLLWSPSGEELWRNAISARMDRDVWPELSTTPLVLRALLRAIRQVPVVGQSLWETVVGWVLVLQLLMIYRHHDFWVWCGQVPFTWPWAHLPWPEKAPKWAQEAEWRSAEMLAMVKCRAAWIVGAYLLGLSSSYAEYYVRHQSCSERGGVVEPLDGLE